MWVLVGSWSWWIDLWESCRLKSYCQCVPSIVPRTSPCNGKTQKPIGDACRALKNMDITGQKAFKRWLIRLANCGINCKLSQGLFVFFFYKKEIPWCYKLLRLRLGMLRQEDGGLRVSVNDAMSNKIKQKIWLISWCTENGGQCL